MAAALATATLLAAAVACVPNATAREWSEQLAAAPACTVDVENVADSVLATWREVQARGFNLCVPPDWRILRRPTASGDRYGRGAWRGDGSSFFWDFAPGAEVQQCGVPVGINQQTWFEVIDGENVCLLLTPQNVRAYWTTGLVMGGNARDGIIVDRLLSVIRTVRLVGTLPPPRSTIGPSEVRDLQR